MSAVAGVRSGQRQDGEPSSFKARTSLNILDETSNIPSHLTSTPNHLWEQTVGLNRSSDCSFGGSFPKMMGMAVRRPIFFSSINLTGLDPPLNLMMLLQLECTRALGFPENQGMFLSL